MADKIILKYEADTTDFQREIKKATESVDKLDKSTDDFNKTSKNSFDSKNVKGFAGELGGAEKGVGGLMGNLGKMVPIVGAAFSIGAIISWTTELAEAGKEVLKLQKGLKNLQGVNEGNLSELTAQVQSLSKVFGDSEEDILRAANALSKTFGIDGKEALKEIERGYLGAANANGDLLESVKEYSVQAKDAGLTTKTFINLLDQSGKQGIFSDKGIDTVKEFGLRIREQTKATKDALEGAFGKEFTEKLFEDINKGSITSAQALERVSNKMKDSTIPAKELQTVIADVFGGPGEDTGQDFLKTLGDITDESKNIVDVNDAYTKEQQRQLELEQKFNETLNEVKLVALEIVGFIKQSIGFAIELVEEMTGLDQLKDQLKTIKTINSALDERGKLRKEDEAFFKKAQKEENDRISALKGLYDAGLITVEQFNERLREITENTNKNLKANSSLKNEIESLSKQAEKYGINVKDITDKYGRSKESVEALKKAINEAAFSETKRKEELKKSEELQKKLAEQQKKAAEEREKQIQRETEALKKQAEDILLGAEGTVAREKAIRQKRLDDLTKSKAFERLTIEEQNALIEKIETESAEKINKIKAEAAEKQAKNIEIRRKAALDLLELEAGEDINKQIEVLEKRRDFELENAELLAEEKLLIEARYREQIQTIRDEANQKEIDQEKATQEALSQIGEIKFQTAKSVVDGLAELVDENTQLSRVLFAAQKLFAVADIFINLQKEISGIAAANAVLGAAGVPLTAAQVTAAKVRAGIGIASVVATSVQGFKDGVIDLQGPGTTKSDSIPVRLSAHESVMTAKETHEYFEELNAMRDGTFRKLIMDKYLAPYLSEKMSKFDFERVGFDTPKKDRDLIKALDKLSRNQGKPIDLSSRTIAALKPGKYRGFINGK